MQKLLFKEYTYYITVSAFINCLLLVLIEGTRFNAAAIIVLYGSMIIISTLQILIANSINISPASAQLAVIFGLSYAACFPVLLLIFNTMVLPPISPARTATVSAICVPFQLCIIFFVKYIRQKNIVTRKDTEIANFANRQKAREIEILKQQIDPHFIFNSFNTLSFLIGEDSVRAKSFSDKLANVYRYIIFNNSKNLIGLQDELEFARNYAFLQEIRHSNEVEIQFIGFDKLDNILVLPISIQVLIENAIKHNEFSESSPLNILVQLNHNYIIVENKKKLKQANTPVSSQIGLINLRERCELIMHNELIISDTPSLFTVKLPVHRH